ncbi:MAG: hypothetical protein RLZZ399_1009 [Verrucomicrobiota bacterium]|jgi:hypothetical protein
MKTDPAFESWVTRFLEGSIDPETLRQLEDRLAKDPVARAHFRRVANLDGGLREWSAIRSAQMAWNEKGSALSGHARRSFWPGWSAAAAIALGGLLTGVLSSSLVFARTLSQREPVGVHLPLANGDFSAEITPLADGPPSRTGWWSGDFSRVCGAEQGVTPPVGNKMLRMLRADNRHTPPGGGQQSGEMWQLVDVSTLRSQIGSKPARIEVSAQFNSARIPPGERYTFALTAYAFDAEPEEFSELWKNQKERALSHVSKAELSDDDPKSWQRISAQLLLPSEANVLLVCVRAAAPPKSSDAHGVVTFPGQYIADVALRWLP